MPYDGQQASKRGHADIIRNPDVEAFLGRCNYLKTPGDEVGQAIADTYQDAPKSDKLPTLVVASDGSSYSQAINKNFPSTQMGYVKVSLMAFDMGDYNGLQVPGSPFVEPYKLAELHNKGRAVSFVLPGSNVRYKNLRVQDGFRLAIYEQLSDDRTKISQASGSIKDMLYYLGNV